MHTTPCCCGAVTVSVDTDTDTQTMATDVQHDVLLPSDAKISIDAEPAALGCLEIFSGQRQYFCNICANALYTQFADGQIRVQRHHAGQAVTAQQQGAA